MSNLRGKRSVTRQDFLKRLVAIDGITYEKAAKIYEAMVDVVGTAILSGEKIAFGRVMALKPVRRRARKVTSTLQGIRREVHLGDRISYKVSIYKEFMATNSVRWRI